MRLAAIRDQLRRVNCRSDRRETGTQIDQIRKTENRIEYQIRKPAGIFAKTENQMLNNGKSANLNEYKNRKTDLKNSQTAKTENPNAPLKQPYWKDAYLLLFWFRLFCFNPNQRDNIKEKELNTGGLSSRLEKKPTINS